MAVQHLLDGVIADSSTCETVQAWFPTLIIDEV